MDYAAQEAKLDEAIASGVLTVEFGDRRVTYRSLTELLAARDDVRRRAAQEAGAPVSHLVRTGYARGLA